MKEFKITKNYFKKLNFKIEVSPFGKKLCCCGQTNCVDLDCWNYCNVRYKYLNNMTIQEYEQNEIKVFNAYESNPKK